MDKQSTGNRKLDSLRDRAASKIIWGESEEDVYKFLRKEGVSPELADDFIEAANRERAAIIRQRSLIKFIAGTTGTLICGGLLGWFEFFSNVRYTGSGYWKLFGSLWTGLSVCGIFTLKNGWSLLTGKTRGYAMDD